MISSMTMDACYFMHACGGRLTAARVHARDAWAWSPWIANLQRGALVAGASGKDVVARANHEWGERERVREFRGLFREKRTVVCYCAQEACWVIRQRHKPARLRSLNE